MPVMRDILNSTGQERTAWLNRTLKPAEKALRYYLGPDVARAGSGLGQLLTEMSPAADIRDMAQSSRDLMGSGSPMDAAGNAAMLGAAALGVFTPGSASSVKGASSDGVDAIVKALREGRAGEVTDDMLGALTPEQNARLFNAYERGETGADMAMDEASRMARMREMKRDVDAYHGGANNVTEFDPSLTGTVQTSDWGDGTYLAPEKSSANYYAGEAASRSKDTVGDAIYKEYEEMAKSFGTRPMFEVLDLRNKVNDPVAQKNYATLTAKFDEYRAHKEAFRASNGGVVFPLKAKAQNPLYYQYEGITDPYLGAQAKSSGNDAVFVHHAPDRAAGETLSDSVEEILIPDPSNIRSRFARFDPRLSHLSNLSAAVPLAVGAGAASRGMQGDESSGDPELDAALRYIRGGD